MIGAALSMITKILIEVILAIVIFFAGSSTNATTTI